MSSGKYYYRMKEEKRCIRCGKQDGRTLDGRILCVECARMNSLDTMLSHNILYEKRIAAGLCKYCGKENDRAADGKTHCTACYERQKEYQRRRRQEISAAVRKKYDNVRKRRLASYKAQGRCTKCGKQDVRTLAGYAICEACRVKAKERAREWRRRKKDEGKK